MAYSERLSALAASFLGLEDDGCHMHVRCALIFDAGPDFDPQPALTNTPRPEATNTPPPGAGFRAMPPRSSKRAFVRAVRMLAGRRKLSAEWPQPNALTASCA